MEIKFYLKMLQRRWWVVVITILVALNVALISAYFTKPIYKTSVRFSISPSATEMATGQETLDSLGTLDSRTIVQTFAEFLNSDRIYDETVKSMNLDPASLNDYTRTTVVLPDANILELTMQGYDPKLVALLANNTGLNAITHIKQLYKVYDINVLDPALVPTIPISPKPLQDAGVAALLGLVIGAALAISSEQIRLPLESYRQRASLDPVSMVLNHRYFVSRIDELIASNPSEAVSVGLVRLNNLRDLIDIMPQNVVQQLMRQVAATLLKELRGSDLVGRWNETTFSLLLPSTNETAAQRTMERIRLALDKPVTLENYGETIELDPCVSVSSYHAGDTTADVTERAEALLAPRRAPIEKTPR